MFYNIFSLISASTILLLCVLFLITGVNNRSTHMLLWGAAATAYSCMFLLDAFSDVIPVVEIYYVVRELLALAGSWFFLQGSALFFQKRIPRAVHILTVCFFILIILQLAPLRLSQVVVMPNLLYCSGLVIASGLMFLLYSWDKIFPEKIWTGALLLLWSVLMNQTGFTDRDDLLTDAIHGAGVFTVTALIMLLILVSDKKTQILTQKLSEELQLAEKRKNELLENISHEIKTPITLIQGYTETLLEREEDAATRHEYLEMLYTKAHMLSVLADDFAQAMTSDSQDIEYKFYEMTAAELFEPLISQCRDQAERAGRAFTSHFSAERGCIIVADSGRIQQAVSNLMNNALRHTPPGGAITVDLECTAITTERTEFANTLQTKDQNTDDIYEDDSNGVIIFSVSDEGAGISPSDLPHIFDRSYSRGSSISARTGGRPFSGLGLYISKNIIEAHGGRITAENRPTGGARFSFELPFYTYE